MSSKKHETAPNKEKKAFDQLINTYLENKNPNSVIEIDFGINPNSPKVTKIEFDKLIIDLYKYGFTIDNKEGDQYYIFIQNQLIKMMNLFISKFTVSIIFNNIVRMIHFSHLNARQPRQQPLWHKTQQIAQPII
jgi:hypothetical protein